MAEKRVGNRSSEGVVAIRHPRTDFPQMGWLSKATSTFYEPNSGFGWFSETQSFRPDTTKLFYGGKSRSNVRQFYQTEPQQGWLNKPVNLNLYEANRGFGWFSETQSYRPNENRNGYRTRQSAVRPFYQTEPQQGWIGKPNLTLYEARGGTAWFSQTQTWVTPKHPARDLDRWDQNDATFDVINFTAAFDPSLLNWQIPSARIPNHPARDLDRWDQDDANFDVVNFAQAFDPAIQDWHIDSARTSQRLGRFLRDTNTDVAWINQNLPVVFDPAIQDWHIDSARTAKKLGTFLRETAPDNSWMGDHAQLNEWDIPADRMRLGPRYQRDTNTDVSWIFPNLPAFDPSTQNWTSDSPRTTKSLGRFIRETSFDTAWMGAQYAWPIPSDRMAPGRQYRRDTNTDVAWIFPNLPVVFDPAIQDWKIHSHTYRSRAWWSDRPLPIAWLVPSVVFDPALWPGTTIDSHRRWNKRTGQWQPDLDNAWLQTSVTVNQPFDATTQFAAIGIPGTRTPAGARLQVARYQSFYDLSWLHDVIPLTDPVPTPNLGRLFYDVDEGHWYLRLNATTHEIIRIT